MRHEKLALFAGLIILFAPSMFPAHAQIIMENLLLSFTGMGRIVITRQEQISRGKK